MPIRTSRWPAGTPCWVDLAVPDVPGALRFYTAVLGWSFVDTGPELGNYQIAQVRGHAAAGIGPLMQEGQPSAWTIYLASDDADATAKAIAEHGGRVLVEPMEIPGTGRMVIAVDPTGAAFGVWQATEMIGAGVYNEPGSLVWEDARLPDPAAAKRFYADVFGYTYRAVEGAPADYETFGTGGDPFGGMGGLMGGPEARPAIGWRTSRYPTSTLRSPPPSPPAAASPWRQSIPRSGGWPPSPTRSGRPSPYTPSSPVRPAARGSRSTAKAR